MKKVLEFFRYKSWIALPLCIVLYFMLLGITYSVSDSIHFFDYAGLVAIATPFVIAFIGALIGITMSIIKRFKK